MRFLEFLCKKIYLDCCKCFYINEWISFLNSPHHIDIMLPLPIRVQTHRNMYFANIGIENGKHLFDALFISFRSALLNGKITELATQDTNICRFEFLVENKIN